MNKHLIIATAAMLLAMPTQATATDRAVSSYSTEGKVSTSYKTSSHYKIPGTSPSYIRNILKKAARIGLTDKQFKELGGLLVEAETGAAEAHAQAELTVAKFRTRLHSGHLSDKEIHTYTSRMGELRSAKLQANLMASVRASRLLTAEQKSKLYAGKKSVGFKK